MTRAYKIIDADGHILEPLDLWDRYMNAAYRERAPRLILDDNGKERLLLEGQILGNPKGLGRLGAVGARDGSVPADTMKYKDGRPGGFDPHERVNANMPALALPVTVRRAARARGCRIPSGAGEP